MGRIKKEPHDPLLFIWLWGLDSTFAFGKSRPFLVAQNKKTSELVFFIYSLTRPVEPTITWLWGLDLNQWAPPIFGYEPKKNRGATRLLYPTMYLGCGGWI